MLWFAYHEPRMLNKWDMKIWKAGCKCIYENWYPLYETIFHVKGLILSVLSWTIYSKKFFTNTRYEKGVLQFGPFDNVCKIYSSANKIFAVLRRNRSDPLSRAMGCIGELRAGSRSAGYERFGSGNLAPLAVLVPIPKPATHSKGASNQHSHCTVFIWLNVSCG